MRPRGLLVALLVLAVAAVCVRLGAWQLSRWQEKRGLNAAMRAGLAASPLAIGDALPADSAIARRVVAVRGRWDRGREVLVAGGLRDEVPVAHLVVPLVLAGGEAVLVDRGMVPADGAMEADFSGFSDSAAVTVRGWAEPMRRGAGSPGPRLLPRAVNMRWSARWLDADSLGACFPYRIARVVVREMPGADTPAGLARDAPAPLDEGLHLGYAVQWFAIALVVLGGGVALALRKPAR